MTHHSTGILAIPGPIGGRIREYLAERHRSILEALARERHHRKAIFELSCYSDRELADMGIARCDIPRLVRGDQHRETES